MLIPLLARQSYTGILDTLGVTPLLAYSSTRLRRAYTGAYARIRRVSDNAETDIDFLSDGTPDLATANTFIGASSAKVVKVYSQGSRASSDMAQSSASNQPAWEASSGIPVYTAASSNYLTAGASINLHANSVYTIFLNNKTGVSPTSYQSPVGNLDGGGTIAQAYLFAMETQLRAYYGDAAVAYRLLIESRTRSADWEQLSWVNSPSSQDLYRNGAGVAPPWDTDFESGSPVVPTISYGNLSVGRPGSFAGGDYYFDGHIDDVIVFDSVLTAQQIAAINTALAH